MFKSFGKQCFDIRSFYDKILDKYGRIILGGHIYFALNEENYDKVYALERIRNLPWKTSFMAKSKYSLGSLDEALKENETLLLSLFTLRTRKTGKIEVSVCKDEDGIHLNFVVEMKNDNNKQEKAIHELVQEIADGKDIIDHTPT